MLFMEYRIGRIVLGSCRIVAFLFFAISGCFLAEELLGSNSLDYPAGFLVFVFVLLVLLSIFEDLFNWANNVAFWIILGGLSAALKNPYYALALLLSLLFYSGLELLTGKGVALFYPLHKKRIGISLHIKNMNPIVFGLIDLLVVWIYTCGIYYASENYRGIPTFFKDFIFSPAIPLMFQFFRYVYESIRGLFK